MKNLLLLPIFLFFIGISSIQAQELVPVVKKAAFHDTSKPLRDKAPAQHNDAVQVWKDGLVKNYLGYKDYINPNGKGTDPNTVQTDNGSRGTATPIIDFDGSDNQSGVAPPDTDGDVGPNHYVQMVNSKLQIFDKSGNSLYGPVDNSTIWDGFNGAWTDTNDGDPIVLYDEDADRWFVSQFAVNTDDGSQWLLLAVSQTADPLGSYHRYAFEFDNMPDYPHFGIWPDGYYVSINQFSTKKGTRAFEGCGVAAFDRDQMLNGNAAEMVFFDMGSSYGNLLPADCDGGFPALGTPNYFTYFNDDAWGGSDELGIWAFDVDWNTPANSTYNSFGSIAVSSFDADINNSVSTYSRDNISQSGTSQKLHVMSDRLMYRLQFRDFGTYQTMVCNHTIDVGSERAGVRWYELRRNGGAWSLYQEGTYAPADGENRWMGSIAMNGNGDIALGYSVCSGSSLPSIRYTGRLAGDPLGTMSITEQTIITSSAAQTGVNRWGDYSNMSIDPSNDLTFWYTQEYTTGGWNWATRIASFNLEDFGDPTLVASAVSTSQIDLSWTKNGDGDDVMVAWSSDGTFGTPNDGSSYSAGNSISGGGTVLYVGSGTSYNHTALTEGTTYYYKAWSLTNGNPDYSPGVTAVATTLKDAIFYDGFETDEGWTFIGEWERDAPQGLQGDIYGNPDPTTAFNGSNVLGLDLTVDGDYQGSLTDHQETAISPVIDCSNYEDVEIEFQRWLGVEQPNYDHAYLDISNDGGSSWTELWTNSAEVDDGAWNEITFDVSAYADGQASVQFRFSMGATDGSWNYCGWNLDDFYVFGVSTSTTPTASVSSTAGCGTGSVTVNSDMSGTQTFYLRDNAGGAISDWTGNAISHEFTGLSDGTYKGQVEKDGNLSALSGATLLTNNTNPVAPTSVQATETDICSGTEITLSYTGGSGDTFEWYSGSCGGTSVNATVSPTTTTTYYGRWENSCGESTCESVTITVSDLITADAGNDDNTCNATYQLSGNNPASGTGTWTIVGGGATITNANLYNTEITISNSPVTLSWSIENGACEDSDDVTITLDDSPVAPTSVQATETDICSGSSTTLSYTDGSGVSFEWYTDDCGTTSAGTGQDLLVSPTTTTTYYGRWENSCGASTCETVTITVSDLITAYAGDDDNTCNATYILAANNPTPGTGTWTIVGGGATITDPNLQNTEITITDSPVTLSWSIENGACLSSDQVTITQGSQTSITDQPVDQSVNDGENASFSVIAEGENLTYQWRFEGTNIDGADEDTYQILSVTTDDAGYYSVIVTGTCGSITSDDALLSVITSIDELADFGINIYPNPSSGLFNISYSNNVENVEVIISDITGKVIYSEIHNSNINTIDLTSKSTGVYLIKFNFNNQSIVTPIIIE